MTSVETPVNVPDDSSLNHPTDVHGDDETERAAAMVFASREPNLALRGLVLATLMTLALLLFFFVQFLDRQANAPTSAASEEVATNEELTLEDLANTRGSTAPVPTTAAQPTTAAEPTATSVAPTATTTATAEPTATEEPTTAASTAGGLAVGATSIEQLLEAQPVTFEPNSFAIDSDSQAYLNEAAELIAADGSLRVEVAGFADSLGGDGWNSELSQTRATTVRQYLIEAGAPASRLVAQGYGRNEPVASNDTSDGRNANRRVELRLIPTT